MNTNFDDLSIRLATVEDAQEVRAVAIATSIDAWALADYEIEAERDGSIFLVARCLDSKVLGFLLARRVPGLENETDAEIFNLAISPDKQGGGCATALFRYFTNICRADGVVWIWLEVRSQNDKALRFYEKMGFSRFDLRRGFYSDPPDDAIVMGLRLDADLSPS